MSPLQNTWQDSTPETIAAVATAPGTALRGMVRISGPLVVKAVQTLCEPVPSLEAGFSSHVCTIRLASGCIRVPGLVCFTRGPKSYTCQDMAEFHTPGNPVILRELTDSLIALGCEPAGPGEFTRRAFLNGRMDLAQAEAVEALIRASSDAARKQALAQIKGRVSRIANKWQDELIRIAAMLELAIDFSQENINPAPTEEVLQAIETLKKEMSEERDRQRISPARGVSRVLLAGPSNTGKSSLYNRLLDGPGKAIVANKAGTTRDFLETQLALEGATIILTDSAGCKSPDNDMEAAAGDRTQELLGESQVILWVLDISRELDPQLAHITPAANASNLLILNKCDLPGQFKEKDLPDAWRTMPTINTSAVSGQGLAHMKKVIIRALSDCEETEADASILLNTRHLACLARALESLARVPKASRMGREFMAADMREAAEAVSTITGHIYTQDILDHIFANFCIGK